MDCIDLGTFTVAKLEDPRQSCVVIMCPKQAARDELLTKWLPKLGLEVGHVNQLQSVLKDFNKVRKFVTPYIGTGRADMAWIVGRPASVQQILDFIEAIVYTPDWDGRYKDAMKSKLTAADVLEYDSVRAVMADISAQVASELAEATGETGPAVSAGSDGNGGEVGSAPAPEGFESLDHCDQVHWDKVMNVHSCICRVHLD